MFVLHALFGAVLGSSFICAINGEAGSTTTILTCPSGQVITQITDAQYGVLSISGCSCHAFPGTVPTSLNGPCTYTKGSASCGGCGTCSNAGVTGTCANIPSLAASILPNLYIQSCIGQNSCTPSIVMGNCNPTGGDPCYGVGKQTLIQGYCDVPGQFVAGLYTESAANPNVNNIVSCPAGQVLTSVQAYWGSFTTSNCVAGGTVGTSTGPWCQVTGVASNGCTCKYGAYPTCGGTCPYDTPNYVTAVTTWAPIQACVGQQSCSITNGLLYSCGLGFIDPCFGAAVGAKRLLVQGYCGAPTPTSTASATPTVLATPTPSPGVQQVVIGGAGEAFANPQTIVQCNAGQVITSIAGAWYGSLTVTGCAFVGYNTPGTPGTSTGNCVVTAGTGACTGCSTMQGTQLSETCGGTCGSTPKFVSVASWSQITACVGLNACTITNQGACFNGGTDPCQGVSKALLMQAYCGAPSATPTLSLSNSVSPTFSTSASVTVSTSFSPSFTSSQSLSASRSASASNTGSSSQTASVTATPGIQRFVCGLVSELSSSQQVVQCPAEQIITSIGGTYGSFSLSGCTCTGDIGSTGTCSATGTNAGCSGTVTTCAGANSPQSGVYIEDMSTWTTLRACLGQRLCSVVIAGCANGWDPCSGVGKRLLVTATCGAPSFTPSPTSSQSFTASVSFTVSPSITPAVNSVCGFIGEALAAQTVIQCPANQVITAITDSWYGSFTTSGCTCTGTVSSVGVCSVVASQAVGQTCGCATLSGGTCAGTCPVNTFAISTTSWSTVQACVGQNACTLSNVQNCQVLGEDPCSGVGKRLYVAGVCSAPSPTPSRSGSVSATLTPGLQNFVCGMVGESSTSQNFFSCPAGQVITAITSAWYGSFTVSGCSCVAGGTLATSSGPSCSVTAVNAGCGCATCGGTCPAPFASDMRTFASVQACVGQNSCSFAAAGCVNGLDPCSGVGKRFLITGTCGAPSPSITASVTITPGLQNIICGTGAESTGTVNVFSCPAGQVVTGIISAYYGTFSTSGCTCNGGLTASSCTPTQASSSCTGCQTLTLTGSCSATCPSPAPPGFISITTWDQVQSCIGKTTCAVGSASGCLPGYDPCQGVVKTVLINAFCGAPSPSPTSSITPTISITSTSTMSPSLSASTTTTSSLSPSATMSPSLSSTNTATASVTPSNTNTATSSVSPTPTGSPPPSVTQSRSVTQTPSPSPSPSQTPSSSPSPSQTSTSTRSTSSSASNTPSNTPSTSFSSSITPSLSVTNTPGIERFVCALAAEGATASLQCPANQIITSINAVYGSFTIGGCTCTGDISSTGTCALSAGTATCGVTTTCAGTNTPIAGATTEDLSTYGPVTACLGLRQCSVSLASCVNGWDPCYNVGKRFVLTATCGAPSYTPTISPTISFTRTVSFTPTVTVSPVRSALCGIVGESAAAQTIITCPASQVIVSITQSFYGSFTTSGCTCTGTISSTGSCGVAPSPTACTCASLSGGSCTASCGSSVYDTVTLAWAPVQACIGQNACTISNIQNCQPLGIDPCSGVGKRLLVAGVCGPLSTTPSISVTSSVTPSPGIQTFVCGIVSESSASQTVFTCPAGQIITAITSAWYGSFSLNGGCACSANGNTASSAGPCTTTSINQGCGCAACGSGTCPVAGNAFMINMLSWAPVQACIGQNSCSVTAAGCVNTNDPCYGVGKRFLITGTCGAPTPSLTPSPTISPGLQKTVCGIVTESASAQTVVTCPAGQIITSIVSAYYGAFSGCSCSGGVVSTACTPTATTGSCTGCTQVDALGSCVANCPAPAPNGMFVATNWPPVQACVGQPVCIVTQAATCVPGFDPCVGVGKQLIVNALCGAVSFSPSPSATSTLTPSGTSSSSGSTTASSSASATSSASVSPSGSSTGSPSVSASRSSSSSASASGSSSSSASASGSSSSSASASGSASSSASGSSTASASRSASATSSASHTVSSTQTVSSSRTITPTRSSSPSPSSTNTESPSESSSSSITPSATRSRTMSPSYSASNTPANPGVRLSVSDTVIVAGGSVVVTASIQTPVNVDIVVKLSFAGTSMINQDYTITGASHGVLIISTGTSAATLTITASNSFTQPFDVDVYGLTVSPGFFSGTTYYRITSNPSTTATATTTLTPSVSSTPLSSPTPSPSKSQSVSRAASNTASVSRTSTLSHSLARSIVPTSSKSLTKSVTPTNTPVIGNTVTITVSTYLMAGTGDTCIVTATQSGVYTVPVSVSLNFAGSAVRNVDYSVNAAGTSSTPLLVIPAGQTSAFYVVTRLAGANPSAVLSIYASYVTPTSTIVGDYFFRVFFS